MPPNILWGANISTANGTVYTITTENGQTVRRPYTSAGAFLSYDFNTWTGVVSASPEDLALPEGSFIPPRDGKVFCSDRGGDKGTCYLITAGQKSGFTSADVFHGLGYSFNNVQYGDVSFLNATSTINTSAAAHQPGTLVNKNGTVYLVGGNGLLGIPDPATLQSWGFSFQDIVQANDADILLPTGGVLSSRQPEQLEVLSGASANTLASSTVSSVGIAPTVTGTPSAISSSTPAVIGSTTPSLSLISGSSGSNNNVANTAAATSLPAGSHAIGTNVVDSTGVIYMISPDGTRRAYSSSAAFLSYGFNANNQTVPMSATDLTIPAGSFIPPNDGKVVCPTAALDNGTCFLISGGRKASFSSPGLISGLGFSLANALSRIPAG
ncbi:MAG: hypothetical protein P4L74_00315 [Candidatus Doudnabacteria bacterium]|nr:hypothetical protein [Candidatus Doudnabacteria bacterium]